MNQDEIAWPCCQHCNAPMLVSRANQKYCTNGGRCKQAAYSQRKQAVAAKQAGVWPTRAESVLANHVAENARQAQQALNHIQRFLSKATLGPAYLSLQRIISSVAEEEVRRVLVLDLSQAKQDYQAYLARTGFPPS